MMPLIQTRETPPWRHLVTIFALSLTLRALAVAFYHEAPFSDPADYHRLAENVVRGDGYSYEPGKLSAFRACGYPLFLAAIYCVSGVNWYTAEYVQAILGGGTVLLVTALAWLVVGRHEALLSGYIAAVYPGFVWLPRLLLSENLSLFLQLAALCVVVLVLRQPRATRALVLGILLGLNLLTRGGSVFLVAVIICGMAATSDGRLLGRKGLTLAAIAMTAAAATLAPWVVRNYSVFHHVVPIATEDGITIYISYWPVREGGKAIWGNVPGKEDPVVAEAYLMGNEVLMSGHLRGVALGRLREHPSHAFQLIPVKLLNLAVPFDWEIIPHVEGWSRSINYGYLVSIIPALLGAWAVWWRQTPHRWVLWAPLVSAVLLAMVFYGSPRFRLPAEPALVILASTGLCFIRDKIVGRGLAA
jgi:4-amino-4-deoxy-L-arabinose transferase-like glycosyltransferase